MNAAGFPDYLLSGNGVNIPFNSGVPDDAGSYWYMDGEMQGWDSPDGRVSMLTKIGLGPNADGEYPADQHYRGRTLVFTLYASCTSEANREASRYLLAQALDLVNDTGVLTVNEETPKFVTISRSGNTNQGKLVLEDSGLSSVPVHTPDFPTAQPDSTGTIKVLKAQIEVYCQDPRKYAVTPTTTSWGSGLSSVALNNPGNTVTQNIILHMTDTSPFGLTFPTGVIEIDIPALPAGAPPLPPIPSDLIINVAAQTITDLAGDNYYYLRDLRFGPWPEIPPGSSILNPGGAAGSMTYYPAWI